MLNPADISTNDFRRILDDIPYAIIVVEKRKYHIVAANQAFVLMSQFAYDEILGSMVDIFIIGAQFDGLPDGHVFNSVLKRKDSQAIPVRSMIFYVGKKDQFFLVKLDTQEQIHKDENFLFENTVKEQARLIQEINNKDRKEVLRELAYFSGAQIQADHSFFYIFDTSINKLLRVPDDEAFFPIEIPTLEMNRVKKIDFWEPGKRVLSEIHRAARKNQIFSLFTSELVGQKRTHGLWVVAYRQNIENEKIANLAKPLSDWMASILDFYLEIEKYSLNQTEVGQLIGEKQAILDIFQDGYIILDEKNKIVEFNNPMLELIDYSPFELLNGSLELFMNSANSATLKNKIKQAKNPDIVELLQIHNRNGYEINTQVSINRIYSANGNKTILLFKDQNVLMNNRRVIEEATKKATLGEIVADFAHEVRNPINNLTTGLQVLEKIGDEDPAKKDILNRMQEDCIRMNYLMESVLAFSRQNIESFHEIELFDMINRLLFRLKSRFAEKGIILNFRNDTGNPEVRISGDKRALEQVLINLINNAYDEVLDKRGVIAIVLGKKKEHPDYYCLQIADTGSGIPKEIQSKIFEPFVSNKTQGTGLGLAIVQKIIQSHKGWIEYETYTGGTIFTIYLPVFIRGEEL